MIPFSQEKTAMAGYPAEADSPQGVLVNSREELEAFYQENREAFGLDGPVLGEESAFLAVTSRFDDDFFESGALVLVLVREESGGVEHRFTALLDGPEATEVRMIRWPPQGMAATVMEFSCYLLAAERKPAASNVVVLVEEE